LLIVLDTLNNCLGGEQKDTARFDENMNVKLLFREICQFIGNGMRFFLPENGTFDQLGCFYRFESQGSKLQ
jgi:hypothetical protein